jgi:hypothetical protein
VRISFRAKILTALAATVGVLLAGFTVAIERLYATGVADLIGKQVHQGDRTFERQIERLREMLLDNAARIAELPRLEEALRAGDREEAGGIVKSEVELRHLPVNIVIVADGTGASVARFRTRSDGTLVPFGTTGSHPEATLARAG